MPVHGREARREGASVAGRGSGEQVRCERVRDPAPKGPAAPVRGPLAGSGRTRSRSFLTRALAESYRAELIRAARLGLEFDPATGEPVLWAGPGPVAVTWYQHAVAYAAMKWPSLTAHSRASLAEALATVTPALTGPAPGRPSATALRTALYGYAFNPARAAAADEATARVLAWAEKASLPVTRLADPLVLRPALDALTLRLDGRRPRRTPSPANGRCSTAR